MAATLQGMVEEKLRRRIQQGEWAPGTAISSENELCREYDISRVTARSVLTQLVGAGLLYRIPGKGTFVKEQHTLPQSQGSYECIRQRLRNQGRALDTKLLSQKIVPAPTAAAEALGVLPWTPVIEVRKVVYMEGRPTSLNHIWFPAERFPGLENRDITHGNSCEVLEKEYKTTRARVHETLESMTASFDESDVLRILPGHPLLLLYSTFYTEDGAAYEYSKTVFRGDLIRLSFDY